ncbi:MAG: prolyl oligopeptidase family serine peptidase [Gemmatimonadaceae bacterium]|jgi:prolyl oligopeptidase|nr:prolyl oligopeptidase family serine peptidase [Gemmatimonadaceae bacterium]
MSPRRRGSTVPHSAAIAYTHVPHLVAAVVLWHASATPAQAQAAAPRLPVTDRYPGRVVIDPYRWMEGNTPPPRLAHWLRAQDARTTATLAQSPGRDALEARLMRAAAPDTAPRRVRRGGDRLFFLRPAVRGGPSGFRSFELRTQRERAWTLPGAVARHDPSPDGRWVAITDAGEGPLGVYDAARALRVDSIARGVVFAGWSAGTDTMWVRRGTRVHAHHIGHPPTATSPALQSGVGGAPTWRASDAIELRQSHDGALLALVIRRDDAGHAVFMTTRPSPGHPRGAWRRVADATDAVETVHWHGHTLVMQGAPGVLVVTATGATPVRDTLLDARDHVVAGVTVARDGLYLLDGTGGRALLLRRATPTGTLDTVPLPLDGAARMLAGAAGGAGVVLPIDRWVGDGGWFIVGDGAATRLSLTEPAPSTAAYVEERRLVRATDGVDVPMTIVRRRDLPAGAAHLTWVLAYGAYGIAMTPLYQSLGAALRPFLDDGNVYVVAHVRGGGEFGVRWHDAGRAANKPTGYRDLIACAEALVKAGLTQPSRLVIEGSSGGGATVGMAAVTRPDLFGVVFTHVPDANTLRLHATPDGPYMREEWGDIRTRAGVAALAAMDVTHHVRRGVAYPAWWVSTGLLDTSVPPWMPAKLVATLQRAGNARPVLLRVHAEEGHVLRPEAQQRAIVDAIHFAYTQLGHPARTP